MSNEIYNISPKESPHWNETEQVSEYHDWTKEPLESGMCTATYYGKLSDIPKGWKVIKADPNCAVVPNLYTIVKKVNG